MVKCAVPFCKNDSRYTNKRNSDISFHRFPKSREVIDVWVKAIKRPNWEPNIRSYICSVHFDSSCYLETKKGLRKLVSDAVPEFYLEAHPTNSSSEEPSASTSNLASAAPGAVVPASAKPASAAQEPGSASALEEITPTPDDTPRNLELKRQLRHVQEMANRRRLRCNALYTKQNRMKKKIATLKKMIIELRKQSK